MKNVAHLQSLIVSSHTLLEDKSDLATFEKEHFYITAPNPLMVSISGSSEQNMHHKGPKQVLDASSLYCDDQFNMVIATADGLGESEDLKDNEYNAKISAFCSESFCHNVASKKAKPTVQLLSEIASESNKLNQNSAWGNGRTAMSTLSYDALTQRATVLAMGDTLTIVFDGKTGNVKYQQKARVYNQGGSIWGPVDIQLLAHRKPSIASYAQSTLQELHWDLEADDIVVQMTDGIWSEFSSRDTEYILDNTSYIETELVLANIAEIDESLSPENLGSLNAIDISLKCHSKATTNYLKNLAIFQAIHHDIAAKLDSEQNPNKKMQDFVKELSPETATLFKTLYVAQKHDAIVYHDEMPISYFQNQYKRISFGDCSTLSVIKIPCSNEHLLRKLLDNIASLDKYQDVLKELVKLAPDELTQLVDKFRNYRLITSDKVALTEAVGIHAYSQSTLDTLHSFIKHYKNLQVLTNPFDSADVIRSKTIGYIKSIENPEEQKFLSNFFNKCLKFSFLDNIRHFFFKPADHQGLSLYEYKEELDTFSNAC